MRIFPYFICLAIIITSVQLSYSQNIKINGRVVDDASVKIKGVTLVLTHKSDSSVMGKTISDSVGNFVLSSSTKGPALLTSSHLAFIPVEIEIPDQCDTTLVVCLKYDVSTLGNVVITGKRKTISFRDDGNIVVALENIPGYETDNTAQSLRKLPGVMVSPDGQILLNGEAVSIQMDGFEVKTDIMKLLNSLPAVAFGDVELISNVSSQYSFDSGGIINLVSNKTKSNGYTAYLNGSGRIDRDARAGGSGGFFVMIKRNQLYINNSFDYDAYPHSTNSNDSTIYNPSGKMLYKTDSMTSRSRRVINNFNLALDMKHKQALDMNINLFYGVEDRTSNAIQHFDNDPQQNYKFKDHPKRFMVSGNIRYKTGENLPFKIETSYGFVLGELNYVKNINMYEGDVKNLEMTYNNQTRGRQHIPKIDYSQKFLQDKLTITAGGSVRFSIFDDDSKYNVIQGSSSIPNSLFEVRENIVSLYASGLYKITPKLIFNAGVRAEHMDYFINKKTIDEQSSNNYWNVIPNIYLNFKPSSAYSGFLTYRGSVIRPEYELLMPGVHYYNDNEYEVGNPYLKPMIYHSLGLRNILFEYAYLNISGFYIKDMYSRIMIDKGNNVTEYTYENVVDRRNIAINLGLPFRAFKEKLTGQLNFNYAFGDYISPKHGFVIPDNRNKFETMNSSLYVNYQIIPRLDITGYLNYMIKYENFQVDSKSYATLDFSAQFKVTKDKRLILNLSAYDVLNSKKMHSEYFYDDVKSWRNSTSSSQYFSIGISYKFSGGKDFVRDAAYDPNDISRFYKD